VEWGECACDTKDDEFVLVAHRNGAAFVWLVEATGPIPTNSKNFWNVLIGIQKLFKFSSFANTRRESDREWECSCRAEQVPQVHVDQGSTRL
jgi:hypothetical protein